MRLTGTANAIVPGTAFCLVLVAFASLPLSQSTASIQRAVLFLCLVVLGGMSLLSTVTGQDVSKWVTGRAAPQDGMSVATQIGILGTMVQPAIRLRLLPLPSEWQFHLPFFGLVISLLLVLLIVIDPVTSNLMPALEHLSLYTAMLLALLFTAQLLQGEQADDITESDSSGGLSV